MRLDKYTKIAVIDISEHILLGLVSVSPLIVKDPVLFVLAAFFSVFPDIDHLIAARSFSIKQMLSLGRRPFLHSIPAVFLISLVVYLFSHDFLVTYISFITGLTHLVWDLCTGGVRLFYPLKKDFQLSQLVGFVLIFTFMILSFIIIQI